MRLPRTFVGAALPLATALLAATVACGNADPVRDWVASTAVRLNTVDAGSGFTDLQPLEDVVGNARIVALGEPTLCNREVFQLKHRMIEFLVTELGFNVFALESPMAET
jgi:erythromycin esterase